MMQTKFSTPDIYEDLHIQLITGQITQGSKMRSEELRSKYGCSANTIREVLFRLASVELVLFEEQRGFRARPIDEDRRHNLTKFRISLEQDGVTASIELGGLEWEAQMLAAHHKLSHIESQFQTSVPLRHHLRVWSAAEWEFHDSVISACDSPFLRSTYRLIYDQFRQQKISQPNYGYHPENVPEHLAILNAALARDAHAARVAVYNHMKRNLRDEGVSGALHPDNLKAKIAS